MSATNAAMEVVPGEKNHVRRVAGGLIRRYRLLRHGPPPAVTAAEVALRQFAALDPYAFPPADELLLAQVAAALPVLRSYGQRHVFERWHAWLDRTLVDRPKQLPGQESASNWRLAALAAAVQDDSQLRSALLRRWGALVDPDALAGSLLDVAQGRVRSPAQDAWLRLVALETLLELGDLDNAGRQFPTLPAAEDFASRAGWTALAFQTDRAQHAAEQIASLRAYVLRDGQRSAPLRFATAQAAAERVWSLRQFLAASQAEVAAHFQSPTGAMPSSALPDRIDPQDGRWQAVWDWISGFARPDQQIAEVGCGSGRFLRQIGSCLSDLRLTGIDPSPALLGQLPSGIARQQGAILDLPVADEAFDAVLAVEVMEHALVPAVAVDELCRVTRPGGQVLIIDKCRSRQALSQHAPWERWFDPAEVQAWLTRHCGQVAVRPIPHGPGQQRGLFLAWTGVKRIRASH